VLLVGGASTRFGSPKERAEYGGETLRARAWQLLGDACDERIAVGRGGLDDPGTGPVGAIAVGLRAAVHDVAIVVPVDMPLLTVASLHALANACRDAAVAQHGPLPCAVAKRVLPAFESGERRLRAVLAELDTAEIELDERVLANVNTPEELDTLAP
jgi:molybdopterin-guanine dinucleotide biosynthesis protein A